MAEERYERVPPQNVEAEQAVLGALFIDPEAWFTVSDQLGVDDFYRSAHKRIFQAVADVASKMEPIDLITVTACLRDKGHLEEVGGVGYLAALTNVVPTAANVEHHTGLVREKSVLRKLISVATSIASTGYEGAADVSEIIDDAEQKIFDLAQDRITRGFTPIRDILMGTFEQIETLYANKGSLIGIPTGYPDLDRMTSGFQPSDLIIVAARPSVGKTAFALNMAQNVAVRNHATVAIFSLEMSKEQLVQRIICAEANIDSQRLRTGFLEENDWPKLTMAIGTLSEAPIYIDDTPNISVAEMRSKCRRLQAEHDLKLIVIDYLQLVRGKARSENRQQEISEISRTLKALARELKVPVIALSQLSRGVEQRQDKRPLLSDIRESGSIEQDADVVAFLYRDDYYNEDSEKKNIIEIIIAKQRNGPTGKVELVFLKNYNKFVSLEKTAM